MLDGMIANSLEQALGILSGGIYTAYAGGTDLMIEPGKSSHYLYLHKVPELKRIYKTGGYIHIGAACTFSEALKNLLVPDILKAAVKEIAAPAIRNLGTFGGNIANGSAKADSALIFFVTDSLLRLASIKGERIVTMKEFYKGRKELDLRDDELIVEIMMPSEGLENFYYKKVGARKALAIARLSFAGVLDVEDGKIRNCATAFGAISDVIVRSPQTDAMLVGKTLAEAKLLKQAYINAYANLLHPISGRISSEYRKTVCMNLLRDFLLQNGI